MKGRGEYRVIKLFKVLKQCNNLNYFHGTMNDRGYYLLCSNDVDGCKFKYLHFAENLCTSTLIKSSF